MVKSENDDVVHHELRAIRAYSRQLRRRRVHAGIDFSSGANAAKLASINSSTWFGAASVRRIYLRRHWQTVIESAGRASTCPLA